MCKSGTSHNAECSRDPSDQIVKHDPKGIATPICPPDWAGFPNIKEAKGDESCDPSRPERQGLHTCVRRSDEDRQQGNPLACNFVDHDF